jgi:SAM-dependent methyltransferase
VDDDLSAILRQAYDQDAADRDERPLAAWKAAERRLFLQALQREGKTRLLEIGAGPGRDSLFFQGNGLQVTAVDLSPEMVRLCRAKGLQAQVMDFRELDFRSRSFQAVFALNSLLHVPAQQLPGVLRGIRRVLAPGGLFYWGQYGGYQFDGIWDEDQCDPQRYFRFERDEQIQAQARRFFQVLDFHTVLLEADDKLHFQALTLRKAVTRR